MIKSFEEVLQLAKARGPKTIAVAVAQDKEVLLAVNEAKNLGIADAILVGDKEEIIKIANHIAMDLKELPIIDVKDTIEASRKAVELVSTGEAHIVMKGLVDTSIILKAVLDEEIGLRTGNILSHVAVFNIDTYHKLLLVTDAAMNIAPDINQKKQIVENAVFLAHSLDIENPKVAVICAKEKVNPKMPATVDADQLVGMNNKGIISDCMIGGPFALDNAISREAAFHKGISHPVAGDADIVLAPNIESGNILYKALAFLAKSKNAGIIVGAKAPIVLTSRADNDEAKLNSIALGVLMASKK
ncbi:phosphate butyryltransferase [Proteiniborus ethanoligenes]|uniref:Phosphate butyryltransferase n=1 Tax=Proteiniborus ethanoligenes TaxID=415015 RepID=A0A1H3Q9Q3_9FIRM|nr:phosphate butyryltransferase [Proteiniborus ethanoligenes]SDZ09881.1 phosphate butyryltransferase [Proteiniborus ethanoligenes]